MLISLKNLSLTLYTIYLNGVITFHMDIYIISYLVYILQVEVPMVAAVTLEEGEGSDQAIQ
jgi:hypothetical protein